MNKSKEFMIVFVINGNQYGLAFTEGSEWLAQYLFTVDDPKKESCLISEKILWRINDLYKLGYNFKGIMKVEEEKDFWNINDTLAKEQK